MLKPSLPLVCVGVVLTLSALPVPQRAQEVKPSSNADQVQTGDNPTPGGAPVFVGILRLDGLLVPVAINDGREWWDRWPFSDELDEAVARLSVPESLSAIPAEWLPPAVKLPVQWTVQLSSGLPRSIRLRRPERPANSFSASTIAIRTDFVSKVEVEQNGHLEAGVAVAGPATLGRIEEMSAAEFRPLAAALVSTFNRAEDAEIAGRFASDWKNRSYTFPATERERAATPYASVHWQRAGRDQDGRTFYNFSGMKSYGIRPYPECDATVLFRAIIAKDTAGRISAPLVQAYTTGECQVDGFALLEGTPLATLRVAGRVLWVMKSDGEPGLFYTLVNPAATAEAEQIRLKR